MSKYLTLFSTEAQWQAAQDSLDYPNVSLIDTTGDLHYTTFPGKEIADAPFGSIIMGEVATDTLFYIDKSYYNLTDYPLDDFKPIGICIYDRASNANNQTIIMSVQFPSFPTLGGTSPNDIRKYDLKWGFYNIDLSQTIPEIRTDTATSFYINEEIKKITDDKWKTESSVVTDGSEPCAFIVCWRFKTVGTKEGDWMLPSKYDYGKYASNYSTINSILTMLRDTAGTSYVNSLYSEGYLSNEHDNKNAKTLTWPSYGGISWSQGTKTGIMYGIQRPVMIIGPREH